mmetsp:Transcript_23209/g.38169  ORF Transcript_23209/g.38169 Transcript_23209/m.38169 type:complete len:289 (-) Transcript_23209:122-988(-)
MASSLAMDPTASAANDVTEEAAATPDAAPGLVLRLHILDGTGSERKEDVPIDRTATLADLKARHFHTELARGWRLRCVFLGRLLSDADVLAELPSGSLLQCYLQPPPADTGGADTDPLPRWAWPQQSRHFSPGMLLDAGTSGGSSSSNSTGRGEDLPALVAPGARWQDSAFHALICLGIALAWGAYFADPKSFDTFGQFVLHFFSVVWGVVFSADLIQHSENTTPWCRATFRRPTAAPAQESAAVRQQIPESGDAVVQETAATRQQVPEASIDGVPSNSQEEPKGQLS